MLMISHESFDINLYTMSTVPKFTYAKVGKGSKTKVESASSQLLRSKQEKSDDIFSHMNQGNLNYIKKQLKMKKNRSQHERPKSPEQNPGQLEQERGEEATQRYKIYQKYRRDEQVSEKEPHLEDTERRSEQGKGVDILLPEDIQEDYDPNENVSPKPYLEEKAFISSSHHGAMTGKFPEKTFNAEGKMYQSLPYEDPKQRISSIEGYFGEAVSANLNRQEGQFMEFLEEYISDLNHSKNLKSRENEEGSIEKQRNTGYASRGRQAKSRESSQKNYNAKIGLQLKENQRKLDRLNRNSDTFGQRNSKYTVKNNSESQQYEKEDYGREYAALQEKLKEQKLYSLNLAKIIEEHRSLLTVKEEIIKKLQTDKELLKEEVRHMKVQQSIINKGKKSVPDLGYSKDRRHYQEAINENKEMFYEFTNTMPVKNQRNPSSHPQKTVQSHRSSFRNNEEGDLFQQFAGQNYSNVPASREKRAVDKESLSLERLKREYNNFITSQVKKESRPYRGGKRF